MMKQETIQIKELSIGYRGKTRPHVVAQNINATICDGELTCLLGANGAGKSTLIRTLSAFLRPLAGEIMIMGKPLREYTDKQLATVIGVVLTGKSHLRNITVSELIGLGRSPYTGFWGTLKKKDQSIVENVIELVGIGDIKTNMVHTLSDGERQKVMIAKALAQETPIIFLDEPTAFIDYPSKIEILHLLHRLSREMRKTIFFSTHDLELALQIADQIWLMERNKELLSGTPEDLALDGSLGVFFKSKGVAFDPWSGLYRVDHLFDKELHLKGNGLKYSMMQKALRRNAIYASSDVKSQIVVVADDTLDGYTIHTPKEEKLHAKKISDVLDAILLTL
jgi:iron complex transport system ATP-binding protein